MASTPPCVRLGTLLESGLAPAILAIVERGAALRGDLAAELRAEVELAWSEPHPPVRVRFAGEEILVEDGPAEAPDLRVEGALGDIVALLVTPLVGGLPNPFEPRGRAALAALAAGRVRVEGKLTVMRRVLALIRI